jgi:hypothetical protein
MVHLDDTIPQHSSARAAAAAGITQATLKNWTIGKFAAVSLSPQERPGGGVLLHSTNRVLQYAIMAQLAKFGIGPKLGAENALRFTGWGRGKSELGPPRMPGKLFKSGRTFLAVLPRDKEKIRSEVVHIEDLTSLVAVLETLRERHGSIAGVILLNLNEIDSDVRSKLAAPAPARNTASRELESA